MAWHGKAWHAMSWCAIFEAALWNLIVNYPSSKYEKPVNTCASLRRTVRGKQQSQGVYGPPCEAHIQTVEDLTRMTQND